MYITVTFDTSDTSPLMFNSIKKENWKNIFTRHASHLPIFEIFARLFGKDITNYVRKHRK